MSAYARMPIRLWAPTLLFAVFVAGAVFAPDLLDRIQISNGERLRELLPAVAESLKPPGDGTSALGVTEDDVRNFALQGLTRRLAIIGVPLETVYA